MRSVGSIRDVNNYEEVNTSTRSNFVLTKEFFWDLLLAVRVYNAI